MTYFIPYQAFVTDFLIITTDQANPSLSDVLEGQLSLIIAMVTALSLIIGAVIGVGVWLKKTVTHGLDDHKQETRRELEQSKKDTKVEIDLNRAQITAVKVELANKIDKVQENLSDKLVGHKELFTDIKRSMEKINDKLDQNTAGYNRNVTRLDHHEDDLNTIKGKVYGYSGYDESLKRIRTKHDKEDYNSNNSEDNTD